MQYNIYWDNEFICTCGLIEMVEECAPNEDEISEYMEDIPKAIAEKGFWQDGSGYKVTNAAVAQLDECRNSTPEDAGSSPASSAKLT